MRYIGLDLAWGTKNTTAAVALRGVDAGGDPARGAELLACEDALTDDDSIIAFVRAWGGDAQSGEGVLVGIDAPLLVPNQTGRRPCEAVLSRCMARVQAGPHPANRNLVATGPGQTVRGETLAARLAGELHIAHTPYLDTLGPSPRACFEVFPHPAHIALFGLDKTLKYKLKPNRTLAMRASEFRRYVTFLRALETADPPLSLPAPASNWINGDIATLRPAAALKRYEDALDALTCAYVALYRHRWGDARCPVVGDLKSGYIVTPATDTMAACFRAAATASAPPDSP